MYVYHAEDFLPCYSTHVYYSDNANAQRYLFDNILTLTDLTNTTVNYMYMYMYMARGLQLPW